MPLSLSGNRDRYTGTQPPDLSLQGKANGITLTGYWTSKIGEGRRQGQTGRYGDWRKGKRQSESENIELLSVVCRTSDRILDTTFDTTPTGCCHVLFFGVLRQSLLSCHHRSQPTNLRCSILKPNTLPLPPPKVCPQRQYHHVTYLL